MGMSEQRLRTRTGELRREQKLADQHLKVHDQQIGWRQNRARRAALAVCTSDGYFGRPERRKRGC
jgi:hypothetical protein